MKRWFTEEVYNTGCWPHGPTKANAKDTLFNFWAEYGVFEEIKKHKGHDLPTWAAVCIGSDKTVGVSASAFKTTTFESLGISAENASTTECMVHFMHESIKEGPDACWKCKSIKMPA